MGTTAKKKTTSRVKKAAPKKITVKKPTAKRVKVVDVTKYVPTELDIRQRAFELYEARGCEDGYDLDDWLRAESELGRPQLRA
ncbi:MAG: DUF2934 domain-containing protein [bacterium]